MERFCSGLLVLGVLAPPARPQVFDNTLTRSFRPAPKITIPVYTRVAFLAHWHHGKFFHGDLGVWPGLW